MDWTKPIPLAIDGPTQPFRRLTVFFGHYDLRVYLNPECFIDIGAGSLSVLLTLGNVPAHGGYMGSIGRCCEAAPTAQVMVRADHANDKPVNICFGGIPVLHDYFSDAGMAPLRPVNVGNGVVISTGACITPGVRVNDGVVIGAGAVVTKEAAPFEIVGGVPARKLSQRQPSAPWWDFTAAYLMENKERLQDIARNDSPAHQYRQDSPRFVMRHDNGSGLSLIGFLVGDQVTPFDQAPEGVRWYVHQYLTSEAPMWLADCWNS